MEGVNSHDSCIEKIAEQLSLIAPIKAYLLVPTRPPAESSVKRASSVSLSNAARIIRNISGTDVECITGDEKEEGFFFTESVAEDLLSIASVHPVREDIIDELLRKRKADKKIVTELVKKGELLEFEYEGKRFYRKNMQK